MASGIVLAIIEVLLIFGSGFALRYSSSRLKQINPISYYWFILTIVTGFLWETSYLVNYNEVGNYSQELIDTNKTVWTEEYSLIYVFPNLFAYLFYSTYAAWADREYMSTTDDWSRVVESSHAVFCGFFALLAICYKMNGNQFEYILTMALSMGTQIMNSLLYMVEYFIQTTDPNNVNYNNPSFPTGVMLSGRPFMWINIFWLVLPTYTVIYYLCRFRKMRYRVYSERESAIEANDDMEAKLISKDC